MKLLRRRYLPKDLLLPKRMDQMQELVLVPAQVQMQVRVQTQIRNHMVFF